MEPFTDFPEPQLQIPEPPTTNYLPLFVAGIAFALVAIILSTNMRTEPVFMKIDSLTIHYNSSKGLTQKSLSPPEQKNIIRCLMSNTVRLEKESLEVELLPSTYLIELSNGDGRNSIELISRHNLVDNRGYYYNDCIYELIQ